VGSLDIDGLACEIGHFFTWGKPCAHCNGRLEEGLKAKVAAKDGCLRALVDRSIFQTRSVEQLARVCSDSQWKLDHDGESWVRNGARRVIATQVVEDANKRQRRREQNMTSKVSREAEEFRCIIEKKVLGQVYRFDEIAPHSHQLASKATFPKEAWNPFGHKCSLDARGISSFAASTPWYSPKAGLKHI
jgi:hypothetical protein